MKQVIAIGTCKGREVWIKECLNSLKDVKYQVKVVKDLDGFELGVIKNIYDTTDYEEIFLLHDTCVIKDIKLFDIAFKQFTGINVSLSDYPSTFGMFLGKYTRTDLNNVNLYIPKNKMEGVEAEVTWNKEFASKSKSTILLTPPLHDGYNFVTKNGRLNMKLENDFIIKYKGSWHRSMI